MTTTLTIQVPGVGAVTGLLEMPGDARALYVLGHGAGAGMRHRFMEAIAVELASRRIATLRYNFPYTEAGGRRPDRAPVLHATIRAAIDAAVERAGDRPVLAGGKSMGGRMTSLALSEQPDERVAGLVFLGFPLHAPRQPANTRGEHLAQVAQPMLFLQGTRDDLADLTLLTPIVDALPKATMHIVEGGDHSFAVLKRSGRTEDEVMDELGASVESWLETLT